MPLFSTYSTRGLVERVGQKYVRAGQHPVASIGNEAVVASGTPMDGAVHLLHGFVPHLGRRVIIPQVGEAVRISSQLVQHALQRTGMQGRQTGVARWCDLFVV